MGCKSSSQARKEMREILTQKFDGFDFRINAGDEFTFIQRAKRELSGGYAPDSLSKRFTQVTVIF